MVPMPGLAAAPKAVVPDPEPKLPLLKRDGAAAVLAPPKEVVVLFWPNMELPPKGVVVDAALALKPLVPPKPEAGAVVVEAPKRPPPLDVVAPNGLAAPKAPALLPKAPERWLCQCLRFMRDNGCDEW